MKYIIPKYSEDKSADIGIQNIQNIMDGKGSLQFNGAYIFLAPKCNFRCKGCFTHVGHNIGESLNFQAIKEIVSFAKSRGAKSIIFAGAGEPALDPLYKSIRDYINKKNLQVVLFTNGTTIKNTEDAKKMLISGPVIAKMFSLNPCHYDLLTGRKGAFASSMRGINYLLQAGDELAKEGKNVSLAIDSYVSKDNYRDMPKLLRFCRENKIIPYFEAFIELGQTPAMIKKLALSEKKLADTFLRLQNIDKREFKIPTELKQGSRNYGQDPCNKATHMFCVRENGDVYMCVCTLRKVGNIYERKTVYRCLEDIFNVRNKKLLKYLKCDKCSKVFNL
ncbi:hypothetical protein A2Y83_02915, partial [Candidatus Falkowbacteria bacterium RBG_13_39_14]